jgi:hypothetical protein
MNGSRLATAPLAAAGLRSVLLTAIGSAVAGLMISMPANAQSESGRADALRDLPRTADGRPDLNGTWYNGEGIDFVRPVQQGASICVSGCAPPPSAQPAGSAGAAPRFEPDRPKYRAEFAARVEDLKNRQVREDPVLRCFPPGVPRIGPPDKIVQVPGEIVFLYDDVSGNFFRIIPTDGRGHRDDVEPGYLGDAVGRWEGDTLVVETVNFNAETWLTDDGAFHSTELKVVERLSRDGDTLEWRATAHDPAVLAEPWELRPRFAELTDSEIVEAPPCIERDLDHMVDDSYHANPR